jgi:hypothetical protein
MPRFTAFFVSLLLCGTAVCQQSVGSAHGSAAQPVGTNNGAPNESTRSDTSPNPANRSTGETAAPAATAGEKALVSTPSMPTTKTLSGGGMADPSDIAGLLAPGPLPKSKLSLLGGTVRSIDQIRDRMTLQVFGAKTMKIKFDQRTHFFRDGKEVTQMAVKKGDRVYLDSELVEGKVFARNVHVETGSTPADVRDSLANSDVRFHVGANTTIKNRDASAGVANLMPGSLIAVKFSPRSRTTGTADEISILAQPGDSFTYFGTITHLDLRSGMLAVENQADGRTYEVHFDPATTAVAQQLAVGSQVTITARFTSVSYNAQNIEITAAPAQAGLNQASDDSQNNGSKNDKTKKPKNNDDDDDDTPQTPH